MIYASAVETVGGTPLVELSRLARGLHARIVGKLEMRNPAGSVKDRLGVALIEDAERRGVLQPGMTIVEATGGNTGIGLAFAATIRGYRLILTMPDSMSVERRRLLKALGAQVVLTPAADGMKGAIAKAEAILKEHAKSYMPMQFDNPANPEIHAKTTAEEIWADTGGKVDIIVSGVGTGGTITGVAEVIKSRRPRFKAIAVEPVTSPVITQTLNHEAVKPGRHKIQGIGAGFVPKNLHTQIVDEVIQITDEEAFTWGRRLAKEEGILGGISSGGNMAAAAKVAARPENKGKVIVTIMCSFGERYLSTPLFENDEPQP